MALDAITNKLDYFGPSFHLRIIPANAGSISLQDIISKEIGADITDYASSVQITTPLDGFSRCEVVFSLPYDVAIRLFNTDLLYEGNILAVKLGYPETGDESETYYFDMTLPQVQFGAPRTTVTIKGDGFGAEMRRRVSDFTWNVHLYPELALSLVKILAVKNGLTLKFQHPTDPVVAPRTPRKLIDPTIWNQPIFQRESDYFFLRNVLMAADCHYFIRGTDMFIFQKSESRAAPPICLFRMGGQVDTSLRIFPVEQFNLTTDYYSRSPEAIQSEVLSGIDPRNRQEALPVPITPTSYPDFTFLGQSTPISVGLLTGMAVPLTAVPAAVRTAVAMSEAVASVAIPRPALDQTAFQTGRRFARTWDAVLKGQEESHIHDETMFVRGELTTLGMPRLYPMQIVAVSGVGMYSGNYEIIEVTHKIENGFKTTLKLESNALRGNQATEQDFAALQGMRPARRDQVTTRFNIQPPLNAPLQAIAVPVTALSVSAVLGATAAIQRAGGS